MNYETAREKHMFDSAAFGARIKPYAREICADIVGACYLVVDDDGYLAYVGKSSTRGMRGRLDAHADKRWFCTAHYIETNEMRPEASAERLEQALIRTFQPYANRQRYTASGSARADATILRQYEIPVPFDIDGIEEVPPLPHPCPRAQDRRNPLEPWKGDKPGDLSMRAARHFGQI